MRAPPIPACGGARPHAGCARVVALLCAAGVLAPASRAAAQELPPPPVTIGPPPEVTLPPVTRFELANGLEVRLVPMQAVPVVQVNLLVRSGAATEPLDEAGVADLTADLLDEGTEERGPLELAEALESLGASLATAAGWDASFAALHVPSARLEPALELMAEVVRRPAFAEDELRRRRLQRLTGFLQARDNPEIVASTALLAHLYPDRHRYHARTGGTARTIAALDRGHVTAFYRRHWTPENAALVVTGDVTEVELRPLLERAFGDWRGGGDAQAAPPGDAPQIVTPRLVLVERAGAEQSELRVARVGPPRTTDDYAELVVTATLLGGSFTSRLNLNLRETHGYTYGAFAGFDFRGGPGPVLAASAVHTAVTDSALVEVLAELRRLGEEPPPEAELEKAKRYVALSFPRQFETTGDVAARVGELVAYGLPDDFWDGYVDRVMEVTGEDVRAAAETWFDPDASLVVVVGDVGAVRPGLERLGIAPVEVLSIDDVMGPPPVEALPAAGRPEPGY